MIIEKYSQDLNNVPLMEQNLIHALNMYDIDCLISFIAPIRYVSIIPKKIYLGGYLWDELTSEYYNDKNEAFGLFLQQYIASDVDKFNHPSIVNEGKANIDNES